MIIFVPGIPISQGSKRVFMTRPKEGTSRPVLVDHGGKNLKVWKASVAQEAMAQRARDGVKGWFNGEALSCTIEFYLLPPKTNKRKFPSVRPDLDKLARAVGDALTNVIYRDDSQVVTQLRIKRYWHGDGADRAPGPGCIVQITEQP